MAGSALSSGRRLEITDALAEAPNVEELVANLDQSVANTPHHLRRLARDGMAGASPTYSRRSPHFP